MNKETQPSTVWMHVTPELAHAFVGKNHPHNRPLNANAVDRYAAAMSAGTFNAFHPPICFDTNGVLNDGQHRLRAIIKSGVTQYMPVTRGVPTSTFAYIDIGRVRSMADRTGLAKKEAEVATAVVRLVLGAQQQSNVDLVLRVHEWLERDIVALNERKNCQGNTATLRGALAVLMQLQPPGRDFVLNQHEAFCNDDYQAMAPLVATFHKRIRAREISTTDRELIFASALSAFDYTNQGTKRLMVSGTRLMKTREFVIRHAGFSKQAR